MNQTHEVISAFLDDEPFDANTLGAALSDPEGRDLLIDLMSLRHLMQIESKDMPALSEHTSKRFARRALAAAAVLVAIAGGYFVGERQAAFDTSAPPPATRVVQTPGTWQDMPAGRTQ